MSASILTTNSWPITLPLPFIDYAGAANTSTIVSPTASAKTRRRSRWSTVYATVDVTWKFTRAQYDIFLTFWATTLGNGSAKFELELRYPKNSDLNTWIVQFVSDIQVSEIENSLKEVSTTLGVLTETTLPDLAALV